MVRYHFKRRKDDFLRMHLSTKSSDRRVTAATNPETTKIFFRADAPLFFLLFPRHVCSVEEAAVTVTNNVSKLVPVSVVRVDNPRVDVDCTYMCGRGCVWLGASGSLSVNKVCAL